MKKLYILLVITSLFIFQGIAQNRQAVPPPPCYANGNSGFGGAVGLNSFLGVGDENTAVLDISLYHGGDFNDVLVLYISNGSPGRSVIDNLIDDDGDAYRIAITNSNAFGFGSTITFPPGFEATHAIAVDANFGGLWSIPNTGSVGTNGLNFIKSVNSTITSPSQDISFQISFDWADIGLTGNDVFYYVGMYVSHQGYTSDEGYGDGITPGTEGADDVTFTGYSCSGTLNENLVDKIFFNALYIDGNLKINGLNDLVTIKTYDVIGRLLNVSKNQVYGSITIPIKSIKNQLQFIVIEGSKFRKVLKVLP